MDQKLPRLSLKVVDYAKERLEYHPIYNQISNKNQLKIFMEQHVYSVWDFMSLIKYLHVRIPPIDSPWIPHRNSEIRRFVNELLMEEESDNAPEGLGFEASYISHFELYCRAMEEIGARPDKVLSFIEHVSNNGIKNALDHADIPEPSRRFMRQTFAFLASDRPHVVASALAFGREHIIPWMFRSILKDIGIDGHQAPAFHYYLNRHIDLDADHHGPLSIALVEALCENDQVRISEAEEAASMAVNARVAFWDDVYRALSEGH